MTRHDDGSLSYTVDLTNVLAVVLACVVLIPLYGTTATIVAGISVVLLRPLLDLLNHEIAYRIHTHHGLVMRLQVPDAQAKHDALVRAAAGIGLHLLFARMLFTHTISDATTMTATVLGITAGLRLLVPAAAVYWPVRRKAATVHGPARFK